jgi:hypothetical protein
MSASFFSGSIVPKRFLGLHCPCQGLLCVHNAFMFRVRFRDSWMVLYKEKKQNIPEVQDFDIGIPAIAHSSGIIRQKNRASILRENQSFRFPKVYRSVLWHILKHHPLFFIERYYGYALKMRSGKENPACDALSSSIETDSVMCTSQLGNAAHKRSILLILARQLAISQSRMTVFIAGLLSQSFQTLLVACANLDPNRSGCQEFFKLFQT